MVSEPGAYSLAFISESFELTLVGDPAATVRGVGTLAQAGPDDLTFLANPVYRTLLPDTRAGAVILGEEDAADCPVNCLVSPQPYLAYARVANLFRPDPPAAVEIHPSAVIDPSAQIGEHVSIGPCASIGPHARIGNGCTLGPGVVIGAEATLGERCNLAANVVVGRSVTIGRRVLVQPGAVIGGDGFGIANAGDHWEKVPQLGSVRIGDDCEIGANSCIDRGAIGDTVLEEDVRLDNLVQIGHNVIVGAHSALAGTAAVAGSTTIGKYCQIAGNCGISGHLHIADRVTVTAAAKVLKSIEEPGSVVGAVFPAQPFKQWRRILVRLLNIEHLVERVGRLEKQVEKRRKDE